jgi:hypothetical protein
MKDTLIKHFRLVAAILLLGAVALFAAEKNAKEFTGGVKLGSNGSQIGYLKFGQVALTTGTVAVADAAIKGTTVVVVHRAAAAGTKGVSYEVAITPGTGFTITSLDSSNATQASDTSTISYIEIDAGTPIAAQTPSGG